MLAPTQRFSNRVENYVRYRPGYPTEVLELLRTDCGLNSASVVADIGSGTGKFTELLLQSGCHVFGVEPNQEMREAGERLLKSHPRFTSVAATAEATTLPDRSADLIVAGQAFHWFDRERSREEFVRILKPRGWVALIWNDRRTGSTPFLAAYEALLREFATDYEQVNHRNIDEAMLRQFFHAEPKLRRFPYSQQFDFVGLKGRLLSSSYAPEQGQPKHEAMLGELRRIFDAHQQGGRVAFDYDTLVYYGQLR
ncbi:MAG: class I SAM-dependent methyltransferase [Verrucomicrobiota bacterium]